MDSGNSFKDQVLDMKEGFICSHLNMKIVVSDCDVSNNGPILLDNLRRIMHGMYRYIRKSRKQLAMVKLDVELDTHTNYVVSRLNSLLDGNLLNIYDEVGSDESKSVKTDNMTIRFRVGRIVDLAERVLSSLEGSCVFEVEANYIYRYYYVNGSSGEIAHAMAYEEFNKAIAEQFSRMKELMDKVFVKYRITWSHLKTWNCRFVRRSDVYISFITDSQENDYYDYYDDEY